MKEAVASRGDAPDRPYQMVIKAQGPMIFVSGQGPMDLDTYEVKRGPLEDQIRLTMDNLKSHLHAAGATLHDVVNCRIFLAELNQENFQTLNRVYLEYFPDHRPTRTTVGAQLPGFDVEIDCVACLPE
jgi:2-iminobutanoate/2-iminopropanoate deaminase